MTTAASHMSRHAGRSRWSCAAALLLLSGCAKAPVDCRALDRPKGKLLDCFNRSAGLDAARAELRCLPFSPPERMHGIWTVALESSAFHEKATRLTPSLYADLGTWLAVGDPPATVTASMQGAGPQAFAVELIGRRSLCPTGYGHLGVSANEIIVVRFLSLRRLLSKPQP